MVTWPDLRLDRPKEPRRTVPLGAILALAALGGASCALVGYDFDGYGGAGGGGGTSSQSSGGLGGAGTAGSGGMSSVSSSSGMACKLPSDCDDKDACTAEDCVMGFCSSGLFPVDDGDPCTDDGCDKDKGVYHLAKKCDDGNPCTEDSCDKDKGACSNVPLPVVADGDSCTSDVCDTDTGATVYIPIPSCCPHSVCTAGAALDPAACTSAGFGTACIKALCDKLAICCTSGWNAACAAVVPVYCDNGGSKYSCACAHSYCQTGPSLAKSCDPCVLAVCSDLATKYCCDPMSPLGWNASCIAQTHNLCNIPLGAGCQ